MTVPLIQRFRTEQAPQAPMLYVDTGPDGEHIDAMLSVGGVAVLAELKEVIEATNTSRVIANDLQTRINIETGAAKPKDGYEGITPTILTGEEARMVKSIVDHVVSEGHPKVSRRQQRQLRKMSTHMLKQNEIPVLRKVDREYGRLIAKAKQPISPPLVVNGKPLEDIPVVILSPDAYRDRTTDV